jgi:hypothetical protein
MPNDGSEEAVDVNLCCDIRCCILATDTHVVAKDPVFSLSAQLQHHVNTRASNFVHRLRPKVVKSHRRQTMGRIESKTCDSTSPHKLTDMIFWLRR